MLMVLVRNDIEPCTVFCRQELGAVMVLNTVNLFGNHLVTYSTSYGEPNIKIFSIILDYVIKKALASVTLKL
jgi:hypothetical protein